MNEEKRDEESNPIYKFMQLPPEERIKHVAQMLEGPAWSAFDGVLAAQAVGLNSQLLNSTDQFELIQTAGKLKKILEIRQWPGQVIDAAKREVETKRK